LLWEKYLFSIQLCVSFDLDDLVEISIFPKGKKGTASDGFDFCHFGTGAWCEYCLLVGQAIA
jgi:hypothetical protein